MPPGILQHHSGRYQARLLGAKVEGKACQRPIPGLYNEIEVAKAGTFLRQHTMCYRTVVRGEPERYSRIARLNTSSAALFDAAARLLSANIARCFLRDTIRARTARSQP